MLSKVGRRRPVPNLMTIRVKTLVTDNGSRTDGRRVGRALRMKCSLLPCKELLIVLKNSFFPLLKLIMTSVQQKLKNIFYSSFIHDMFRPIFCPSLGS